ncbi:MAG: DUF924 family protein, partial [Waterburya sp.]
NFWFDPEVKPFWFKKNQDFDHTIKQRFLNIYQQAIAEGVAKPIAGALNHWRNNARGTLALIIILDQFPRNMFRNTPQAFATDEQAAELTKYALRHNYEKNLSIEEQAFLYMPLMHSETHTDQAQCVELFTKLGKEDNLKFAFKHQEVIARFGRFPDRNQILGRESTTAEQEFLTQPGSSF